MTVVVPRPEQLVSSTEVVQSPVDDLLRGIRDMPDANAQFHALHPYVPASTWNPESNRYDSKQMVDGLIDFAADPTASPSLAVRALALDTALDILNEHRSESEELAEMDRQLTLVVPDFAYAHRSFVWTMDGIDHVPGGDVDATPWRHALIHLGYTEGIDLIALNPEPLDYPYPQRGPLVDDTVPVAAYIILEHAIERTRHGSELPSTFLDKVMPLVFELGEQAGYKDGELPWHDEFPASQVTQLHHLGSVLKYDRVSAEQVGLIREIAEQAPSFAAIFPERYQPAVTEGIIHMAESAMYAAREHKKQGDWTDVQLPLHGGEHTLALSLEGDEPLFLLQQLSDAMQSASAAMSDPELKTTLVSQAANYQLYRLWSGGKQNASVYIRPRGAATYNPALEYGRNGEGVEASISFVIDVSGRSQMIEVGKHRGSQPDSRISIRLDREGQAPFERGQSEVSRDPTQAQGTLSLDVGSIIGDDDWVGTKLGRFLAWGNKLRMNDLRRPSGLNHVTRYFDPEDGTAEVFAASASDLSQTLTERRVRSANELLVGRHALSAAFSERK
jgi:hypothetical protein